MHRFFPFFLPVAMLTVVLGLMFAIGNLLLFVGKGPAVWVALALALGVGLVATLLSVRAAKLPPVQLPGPIVEAPVTRRLDLGAAHLIGQFAVIVGAMLVLLFVILALKH